VVIDVADLEEAAAFWSAALDAPVVTGDPAQDRSVSLGQGTQVVAGPTPAEP
jgi:hypothetical protein